MGGAAVYYYSKNASKIASTNLSLRSSSQAHHHLSPLPSLSLRPYFIFNKMYNFIYSFFIRWYECILFFMFRSIGIVIIINRGINIGFTSIYGIPLLLFYYFRSYYF